MHWSPLAAPWRPPGGPPPAPCGLTGVRALPAKSDAARSTAASAMQEAIQEAKRAWHHALLVGTRSPCGGVDDECFQWRPLRPGPAANGKSAQRCDSVVVRRPPPETLEGGRPPFAAGGTCFAPRAAE